jgi:DNA-binding Lrp family transcriptional regulator
MKGTYYQFPTSSAWRLSAIFATSLQNRATVIRHYEAKGNHSVVICMVKAYILIKAAVGQEDHVLKKMIELSVTEEAHKVFGAYDIIAEVRGRDMETLVEIITEKVRKINGIEETESILVIDSEIDMTATSLGN